MARVDRLGPRYGEVFRLRYAEGFTETEIACLTAAECTEAGLKAFLAP